MTTWPVPCSEPAGCDQRHGLLTLFSVLLVPGPEPLPPRAPPRPGPPAAAAWRPAGTATWQYAAIDLQAEPAGYAGFGSQLHSTAQHSVHGRALSKAL